MAKSTQTILAETLGCDSKELSEYRYQSTRTPFPIFAIAGNYYAVRKDKPDWSGLPWEMAKDQFFAGRSNTVLWVAETGEATPAPVRRIKIAASAPTAPIPAQSYVTLTPVGLSTPEGEKRVAAAMKAFEESHPIVANAASQFLSKYREYIEAAMVRADDEDSVADYKELLALISNREQAQDDFLRAVAGAPERAVGR